MKHEFGSQKIYVCQKGKLHFCIVVAEYNNTYGISYGNKRVYNVMSENLFESIYDFSKHLNGNKPNSFQNLKMKIRHYINISDLCIRLAKSGISMINAFDFKQYGNKFLDYDFTCLNSFDRKLTILDVYFWANECLWRTNCELCQFDALRFALHNYKQETFSLGHLKEHIKICTDYDFKDVQNKLAEMVQDRHLIVSEPYLSYGSYAIQYNNYFYSLNCKGSYKELAELNRLAFSQMKENDYFNVHRHWISYIDTVGRKRQLTRYYDKNATIQTMQKMQSIGNNKQARGVFKIFSEKHENPYLHDYPFYATSGTFDSRNGKWYEECFYVGGIYIEPIQDLEKQGYKPLKMKSQIKNRMAYLTECYKEYMSLNEAQKEVQKMEHISDLKSMKIYLEMKRSFTDYGIQDNEIWAQINEII